MGIVSAVMATQIVLSLCKYGIAVCPGGEFGVIVSVSGPTQVILVGQA